jgi:predicted MFS family arabinose efflux permease
LGGAGLGLVMYALSEGPQRGWTSPDIAGSAIAGGIILATFVAVELRSSAPMVQLRLLGNRLFCTTQVTSFFASAGFIGVLFLVPLFLQEARGASPLEAGLTTFPEALGVVVSTQVVARLYPLVGPRRLMAGGLVLMATAIVLLALVGLDSGPWVVRALMFTIGAGMANVFLPNQAASLATISRADTGRATTIANVQRQVGAAVGVAALGSVLAAVGAIGGDSSGFTAYRVAFLVAAVLALIGAVSALRVPDDEAAETMQVRAKRSQRGDLRAAEAS